MVGNGYCQSLCHVIGDPCNINQYYKSPSNIDECQLTCQKETACTGLAFSDIYEKCRIYGNISSVSVDSWINSDAWKHESWSPKSTFGYEGFKVNSSDGDSNYRCFKRLDERGNNDGKVLM